jgi:hypothetical protein
VVAGGFGAPAAFLVTTGGGTAATGADVADDDAIARVGCADGGGAVAAGTTAGAGLLEAAGGFCETGLAASGAFVALDFSDSEALAAEGGFAGSGRDGLGTDGFA